MHEPIDRLFSALAPPLYISGVRRRYEALAPEASTEITLDLLLDTKGTAKTLRFRMPVHDSTGLAGRYLLARLNNLLATFGGVRLTIYSDRSNAWLNALIESALAAFDIGRARDNRTGIGSIINYINRINRINGAPAFQALERDIAAFSEPDAALAFRLPHAADRTAADRVLKAAATELAGRTFLGLDVGGNAIKGALVIDGEIVLLKTLAWFPASLTSAEALIQPIIQLARFFAGVAAHWQAHGRTLPPLDPSILDDCAALPDIVAFTDGMAPAVGMAPADGVFDGIVVGFPDIVVANRIAGGETYKQRGIRSSHPDDYERELARMAELDAELGAFIKPAGAVRILNDGCLASFVVSVEQSFDPASTVGAYGMFAFTIGTEMGTGYISRQGTVLPLPLECYNYIIELAGGDGGRYHENDIRSTRNFNTCVPGTVQKYISQNGLIRMAMQQMAESGCADGLQLLESGLLDLDPALDRLTVRTEPVDCRGILTRRLIQAMADGSSHVCSAYAEIGVCLGVVMDEVRLLFPELSAHAFVSGGLVNEAACFQALRGALSQYCLDYEVQRLDTTLSRQPLLRQLGPEQSNYTVAVGACCLANLALIGGD